MLTWIINNAFILFLGYAACVLFPVPGLNRWIIDRWASAWTWVKSNF